MAAKLTAVAALVWWAAYLAGAQEILELVAALGFTLAWFVAVMRSSGRRVDAVTEKALGPDKDDK